ncbi:hypothetical protein NHX12_023366 [Muraenolepis orangiensis]|uniref:Fork-head domain-containing protein n=1 Tax=Muraenolepis orangiensis TaxID=630683 RepID=A0A9Q0EMY9_9TELE|nr:hypothetical protein NHX12_023366 [Muraenolepis orangiensis]
MDAHQVDIDSEFDATGTHGRLRTCAPWPLLTTRQRPADFPGGQRGGRMIAEDVAAAAAAAAAAASRGLPLAPMLVSVKVEQQYNNSNVSSCRGERKGGAPPTEMRHPAAGTQAAPMVCAAPAACMSGAAAAAALDVVAVAGGAGGGGGQLRKAKSSRRNAWGNQSYADLITRAIDSVPEKRLTLSQIYDWMVRFVPYFKDKGDSNSSAGWKCDSDGAGGPQLPNTLRAIEACDT